MCGNIINKGDVASSLSRMTGVGFESTYMKVSGFNSTRVFNSTTGSLNTTAFRDISRSYGVSDSSIVNEVVNLTGKSYEATVMEMNTVPLSTYKY